MMIVGSRSAVGEILTLTPFVSWGFGHLGARLYINCCSDDAP